MSNEESVADKKVLIIEDDEDIREHLVLAFSQKGFDIDSSADGDDAAEKIKNKVFDCIVTDIKLPGPSGLELAAMARSSKTNSQTTIYICSGNVDERAKELAERLKVFEVIEKPYDCFQVASKVREKLLEVSKPLSYDSKVISIFLEAATEVFEFYFKEKPEIGLPGEKEQGTPARGEITGLIGFSSPGYVGSLGLSLNGSFMDDLGKAIFPELNVQIDNVLKADIVGEMCNQVLGAVKTKFGAIGHHITLGLPEVVMGENHTIVHKIRNPIFYIPIGKDARGCDLEFCLDVREIPEAQNKDEVYHDSGSVLLF